MVFVVLSGQARAIQVWDPPVTFTSQLREVVLKQIAFGRDTAEGGPFLHAVTREWLVGDGPNASEAAYFSLPIGDDPTSPISWEFPWGQREKEYTRFPYHSTDHRFVVDRDDDVHVVSEVLLYPGLSIWEIGYKRRGGPYWTVTSSGVPVSPVDCDNRTPRVVLQETATEDALHVIFSTNEDGSGCSDHLGWLGYDRHVIGDPDATWDGTTWVTNRFQHGGAQGVQVRVDGSGFVHFFGQEEIGDFVYLRHAKGTPPLPGQEWTLSGWETIDTWEASSLPLGDPDPPVVALSSGAGPWVLAWEHRESDIKETYVTVYEPGNDSWVTPYPVSPVDGVTSPWPVVATSGDVVHVLYHEGSVGGFGDTDESRARLWHRWTETPTISGSWPIPTELAPDRTVAVKRPTMIANGDTAYVGYQDYVVDRWVGRFARGTHQDNLVPDGEHERWAGQVHLWADFQVAAGGTLFVAPGTVVIAESADTLDVGGLSSDIQIVVDGTLLVEGESTNRVTFTARDESAGAWGGILFRDAPDDFTHSEISCADFEYPEFAVQVDSLACTLFRPTFTATGQGDVYVDRSTRLPDGEEWDLEAATKILVADDDAASPGNLISITVDGEFSSQPSSGRVRFLCETPTSTGADWEGITVRHPGSFFASHLEVANARNPLAFLAATGAQVYDSDIHTFVGDGVLDWASDARLVRCLLRNGSLDPLVTAGSAIRSLSSGTWALADTIRGRFDQGIWASLSYDYCNVLPPGAAKVIQVDGSVIAGPGSGVTATVGRAIMLEWTCHNFDAIVSDNCISGWPKQGVYLSNAANVQVACNWISDNKVGVKHYWSKDVPVGDDPVHFRRNVVREWSTKGLNVTSPEGFEMADTTVAGRGEVHQPFPDATFVRYRYSGPELGEVALDASFQQWIDDQGFAVTDPATVLLDCIYSEFALIEIDTLLTEQLPCAAISACTAGASVYRGPQVGVSQDGLRTSAPTDASQDGLVPDRFALAVAGNPGSGPSRILLDVPADHPDPVRVRVFDVAGREVRELVHGRMAPGRHSLPWNGLSDQGRRTSAGVYFVVVDTSGFRATSKVVRVGR